MNQLERIRRETSALSGYEPRYDYDGRSRLLDGVPVTDPEPDHFAGLLEYWHMVRRHKRLLAVAGVIGGIGGFLLMLSAPRIYQARTSLEVQGMNEDFMNMRSVTPTLGGSSYDIYADLQTHARILQSASLIESVRQQLAADRRPDDLQPPDRLGLWRKALDLNPPTSDALWQQAIGTAAGSVNVKTSGEDRIVDVSCDSTSAQVAAAFCNTLTRVFIDQNLEARWRSTEHTGDWLTRQLEELKIKLEKSEEELQAYARKTGLVVTGEKSDAQETRLTDLQKELSTAQADRISKQSRYELAVASPAVALPQVLDDDSLKDAQQALATLQAKLAQLEVTFTPSHAEVRKTQAEIDALDETLKAARGNIMTRIRNDFAAAERRERLLSDAYAAQLRLVSGQAEEIAHYNLLKREVDSSRLLHESLLQKVKEASIASALRANNIRVVDPAAVPGGPYKPDFLRRVMLGVMAGVAIGFAFVMLRERSNRTLQDPGDAEHYLGLPELGVIPLGERPEQARARNKTSLRLRSEARQQSVEMISFHAKSSLLAESFRTTLTSILFSRRGQQRPKVIVFTSAGPKEGKTTTVCNLAIALAEIGQRVLVIDADMRRPRVHSIFNVGNEHGLSDLLGQATAIEPHELEAACVPSGVPALQVLPSGGSRTNASTLVHSPRFEELVERAREQFDAVLIDTPPMANMADARVVARFGDALILVIRSGATSRDAALLAKSRLAEDGIGVLGSVLNFWDPKNPGHEHYKGYYDGYHQYYGGGGDSGPGGDTVDVSPPSESDPPVDQRAPRRPQPQFLQSVDAAVSELKQQQLRP